MTNPNTVTVPVELLPCPFCDVTPLMRRHRNWGYFVECVSNACAIALTTMLRETPAEAADDWNRRAASKQQAVTNEDVRWCRDIADDLREAGGPTNAMRLVALERLICAARPGKKEVGREAAN